jgi:Fe-S-cluster-containing hydrogenase component 2
MNKPQVNWEICQACDPCEARRVCKTKAILKIDRGDPVFIEPSLCSNCQLCLPACTYGAIVLPHYQELPG